MPALPTGSPSRFRALHDVGQEASSGCRSPTSNTCSLGLINARSVCNKTFKLQETITDRPGSVDGLTTPIVRTSDCSKSDLKLGLLNARSVRNKTTVLGELIVDEDIDIMVLTETWLEPGDGPLVVDLCPPDYTMSHKCRSQTKGSRGGGVGFVVARRVRFEECSNQGFKTFECTAIKIQETPPLLLVAVYRPPTSQKNNFSASDFVEEFTEFLTDTILRYENFIILGDFNLHWENNSNTAVCALQDILRTLDCKQFVNSPTHVKGHTLDLIIAKADFQARVDGVRISDPIDSISDHSLISFRVNVRIGKHEPRKRRARKIARMDITAFSNTLQSEIDDCLMLSCEHNDELDSLVDRFSAGMTRALDRHAPEKTITLKLGIPKPWYDDEVHEQRRIRRRMERKYKKTRLTVHKRMLQEQSKSVVALITAKKKAFYGAKFTEAGPKETYKLVGELVKPSEPERNLPIKSDSHVSTECFSTYFKEKIMRIGSQFDALDRPTIDVTYYSGQDLENFYASSPEEILAIITKSPSKSRPLDSLPTWLLKKTVILDKVLPLITKIVNKSLSLGYVPRQYKQAIIRPLLKKEGADQTILSNYRPVSNLPFLSKVLEKVVASRLNKHLEDQDLFDPLQSAYRPAHSTETAMVKVKADADKILDDGDAMLLVLLDQSAAFDTIHHDILIERLERELHITREALTWIASYLTDRRQSVVLSDSHSEETLLETGVPQGSVLGPLLFTLYVRPLQRIIDTHGIKRHHYADDSQLYVRLNMASSDGADHFAEDLAKMERCLEDVRKWLAVNKLKLNASKTEMIIISKKQHHNRLKNVKIKLGTDTITPNTCVRDLGSWIDRELTMERQVKHTGKTSYFHLRNISRVRRHLNQDTCAKVLHSSVTVRLDYQNALLAGSRQNIIRPLQRLQNDAARLLTRTPRREHITPVLQRLHWLPVQQRCDFKLLTLVHGTVHNNNAPVYLKDMFQAYDPPRDLRASDSGLLAIPRPRTHEGERSAQHRGAQLWNGLPPAMRLVTSKELFKKQLKTLLFTRVF